MFALTYPCSLWLADCPDWVPPSPFEDITWDAPMHVRLSEALQSQYNLYSAYVDYQHEPFMRFRFRLERQVGYYLSNLVLPMFLIVGACAVSICSVVRTSTLPFHTSLHSDKLYSCVHDLMPTSQRTRVHFFVSTMLQRRLSCEYSKIMKREHKRGPDIFCIAQRSCGQYFMY